MVANAQRFTKDRPCPICQGYDQAERRKGRRCFGFLSEDGRFAHCTRPEHAGSLQLNSNSDTYPHFLSGNCRCGQQHGQGNDTRPPEHPKVVAVYPYHDEDGRLLFEAVRMQPKSFRQRRPDGHGGYIWDLKGVRRVLFRLPQLVAADPESPVLVLEGEKDVDRAIDIGWVATCNPMGAKKWLPEYSGFLEGRRVVIVPDNDPEGRDHATLVAQSLQGLARSVQVVELPGLSLKGDLSDWMKQGHTSEELKDLIESTPEWDGLSFSSNGHSDEPIPGNSAAEVGITKALADLVMDGDYFAVDTGGRLYIYSGGRYVPDGDRRVKRKLQSLLETQGKTKSWSTHRQNEVIEYIRVKSPTLWDTPPVDVLNCRNGLLDITKRELKPHSPEFLSPVQIAAAYDPEAECPAWEQFIREVFPEDSRDVAYEIPAYLMLADTTRQKAVLLVGEGGNGKSTYLRGVLALIHRRNTASLSLQKLESDKFATARLVGKLANICPDIPSQHLNSTSTFKALTGGDIIPAEYKYRDSFEFEPFARLVFSANEPPASNDSSPGFFERWVIVPFERAFRGTREEIDQATLVDQLSDPTELSGLLNRCLNVLPQLRGSGFTVSESMAAAFDLFRQVTDPIAIWLEQNTIDRPDAFVPKAALHHAYLAQADQEGRPYLNDRAFGRRLKKLCPRVQEGQRTVGGRVVWCWLGIGLVENQNR